jgi:hypothetical protein
MAPWPEWQFEYVGTRFLGKLLGWWTTLWAGLIRQVFRLLSKAAGVLRRTRDLNVKPGSSLR